jgi:glycine/D-amino acid oxidase-like deaminating enzyme
VTQTADAVVIGAGVIGAAVAYELAKTGLRVTSVDRLGGVGSGSTSSSASIVRFHYSTFEGVAASWEAKFSWESWAEYLGSRPEESLARFIKSGCLILDGSTQRERVLPLFDRVGVPYECWDAETIRQRVPGMDPGRYAPPRPVTDDAFWADADGELSAYYTPDAGFIDDPQLTARNLMAAAERRGTEVRLREQVVAILQKNGRVQGVELASGGVIQSPVVVNVAGPYSGRVNELAGVTAEFRIRTRPLRQEVHSVPAPADYARGELGPAVTDGDLGTYFRSHFGGQLIVGSAEPECDALHWIDDPDVFEAQPTAQAWDAQVLRLARRIPSLSIPPRPVGYDALYDVADDWIPVYDRTSLAGFYVAIGTSGNQFKNAPVAGRFMAALVHACENGHDHDSDPVVYSGHFTGHEINLGHYSRLRQPHAESAGNVMG